MKRWWLIFMVTAILLAGCASPKIRSDVTVFEDWPGDARGQTFVFERTKDQDNNLEYRTYEAIVRTELQKLGFIEAAPAQTPQLRVTLNYSMRSREVRVVEPVVIDSDSFWPHYHAFYGHRYYPRYNFIYSHRWHRFYYSPFYDPFWPAPPIIEYRERNEELFTRQLRIVLSRAADAKKLYEVTVNSEGRNNSLTAVMPYLVRSAFTGFPGKNGESRRVELEIQE